MQKSNVTPIRAGGRDRAVVFVHGYSGARDDTWDRFPALLGTANAEWDIYTLGYATNTFLPDIAGIWSADPDLPKLATLLRTNLGMPPFDGYRSLVLIAHSMGGLIVQKALVDDPAIAKRLKHVILFGTPSGGLAKAGWLKFWKQQLNNMARGSDFIKTLREDWTRLYADPPFNFVAVAGASDEFVPAESSLDPFEKRFQKIVDGNHVSIVKPDGASSPSVTLVTAILASGKAPSPDVAEELRRASEQPNPKAPALVGQLETRQATLTLQELVNAALALDHLGHRDQAIALLERHRENDTDVKGTLAGRYKRQWFETGDVGHAERALELYRQALQAAEKPDQIYYLAINVAFMNFVYRDDVNAARTMANLALKHAHPAGDDMWKTATVGEAYLYLGRPYDALAEYKRLETLKADDWKRRSAAQQAMRIAAKLGDRKFAEELDAIFSPKAPAAKKPAAKTAAKRPRSRGVDFAILTPTAVEFDTMCEELSGPEDGQDVNWPTKVGTIGEHRVAVVLSGKGQESTAATATLVAQRYKPRWLLLVGIAGGTRKLRRGDLIVASFVYSVDYGKLIEGHFLRRPELDWMADPALSARGAVLAEGVSRPWIADVRLPRPDGRQAADSASVVGYVGSSDKVVDDLSYPMIADALKTATEIDAFEMEAAGAGISVAYTRATHNVGLLMIRGISDEPHGGNGGKDAPPAGGSEQRAKWKRYASHVAAVFSRHLIASMPVKPSARRRKTKTAEPAEERETGDADGVARALVPLHVNAEIVPRDSYRKAASMIKEGELRVLLVRGLPDSGKTSALAFVVSKLHRDFEHLIVLPCDRRAVVEPGYVLERLNESLAPVGRALSAETLQEQSPELLLDQMLMRIVDLDCLMVIDDVQHLPVGWAEKLLIGLSSGRRVRVIASTDRGLPGVNANVLSIPPLDDADAVSLVESSLRARGLPYSPNEVVAKLPQALRSNPAALLAVVAQLSDTDLALWPLSSPAVDASQRAVEEILGAIPGEARDALALLLPIAGIQFGAAYELLGIRERLLHNFALLLDRALVTRGPATYVVPSIVAAAFRARYRPLADERIDFLVTRCVDELREITDNDARTLALGEVVAAVASQSSIIERWSACARLASDNMLTTLHAVGLWKEYTVVLQAGIKAAEALGSGDRVRLACQLSRKLFELGERNEAEAVLDRLGNIAPGSADEARLLSHRALFQRRVEDQIADLQRSIDLHRALGHQEEVAIGWKVIGNLQFLRGERAAARRAYDEALRQFDGTGRRHAIDIAARLAMCDLQDNLVDRAESRAIETLKDCERLRYYAGRRPLLLTLALVADTRGDDARALKLARDAADVPFGDPRWVRMARATADRILKRQAGAR